MKRVKKGLALSRETIRPLAESVLRDAAGGMQDTTSCSGVRCQSTNLRCPTFGSNCCLASAVVC